MKLLKFEGYSDDTFACEGPAISADYDNCASGRPIYMRVEGGGEAMLVIGQYAAGLSGGWQIAVAPVDPGTGDDRHIPDWPIVIGRSEREYSPALFITAPDDVVVTVIDAPAVLSSTGHHGKIAENRGDPHLSTELAREIGVAS